MNSNIFGTLVMQLSNDPSLRPILPFLFVLAVVYGMLSIANVFKTHTGKPMNSVNFIIALVFALFAAGYSQFVSIFFANLGIILWAFIILFFIAFAFEAIGLRRKRAKGKEDVVMIITGIIILLLITIGFSYISEISVPVIGTENFIIIVGIILLLIIFYYAYELGKGGS